MQIYGLVASQLGDLDDPTNPNDLVTNLEGQRVTIAEYLRQSFGYHYDSLDTACWFWAASSSSSTLSLLAHI